MTAPYDFAGKATEACIKLIGYTDHSPLSGCGVCGIIESALREAATEARREMARECDARCLPSCTCRLRIRYLAPEAFEGGSCV